MFGPKFQSFGRQRERICYWLYLFQLGFEFFGFCHFRVHFYNLSNSYYTCIDIERRTRIIMYILKVSFTWLNYLYIFKFIESVSPYDIMTNFFTHSQLNKYTYTPLFPLFVILSNIRRCGNDDPIYSKKQMLKVLEETETWLQTFLYFFNFLSLHWQFLQTRFFMIAKCRKI